MDILLGLLFGAIVGVVIYQLAIKPALKRRAAKAQQAEQARLRQTSRNEPYRQTLKDSPGGIADATRPTSTDSYRLHAPNVSTLNNPIREQLKGKAPLRPISRNPETPAPQPHGGGHGSTNAATSNPGLFFVDGTPHHGFGSRHNDGYSDDKPTPSPEPTRTMEDSTPPSHGWGGSHNDGGGNYGGGYSTGDSGGSFSGGDSSF